MAERKRVTKPAWVDPDDASELSDAWFEEADMHIGGKLVQRGRPKSDTTKQAISVRLDPDVIAAFKEDGPGWQTRINDTLARAVKARKASARRGSKRKRA